MPLKTNIHQIFKNISSGVKPKHQKLVDFGLSAYTLVPFQSAASNARSVIPKFSTACRKSERLLANEQIGEELNDALANLTHITPNSIVNVDHTDSDLLTTLVGAVQTKKGRAIPVFAESTYSNAIPSFGSCHSTNRTDCLRLARKTEREIQSFSEHIISTLERFICRIGFMPKFAFDRGFGGIAIISYLDSVGATFYIRLKSGRIVDDGYGSIMVRNMRGNDDAILVGGLLLRVVRSDRGRQCKEPWYILTNDLRSSRDKIIHIYYHRFEEEETFKDAKNLFELRRARFSKPNSLKIMLLLIFIGIAILYQISRTETAIQVKKLRGSPTHPRKALSWVRDTWEIICLLGWR